MINGRIIVEEFIISNREFIVALAYFFVYSFLGWGLEVSYHAIKNGSFVNRGMLAGAVCPIYGSGALILIYLLEPLKSSTLLLFVGSFLLCSILEFFVGLILDKLFNKRWWDYSNERFNLKGYVCLEFSIYWGVGGIILVKDMQVFISKIVGLFDLRIVLIFVIISIIAMSVDFFATVQSILKLNRRLSVLEELQGEIRKMSDYVGENISDNTLEMGQSFISRLNKVSKGLNGGRPIIEEGRQYSKEDFLAIKEGILKNLNSSEKRFFKAFPNIRERKNKEAFLELKERFAEIKNNAKKR